MSDIGNNQRLNGNRVASYNTGKVNIFGIIID